jgi:hypothetical protein
MVRQIAQCASLGVMRWTGRLLESLGNTPVQGLALAGEEFSVNGLACDSVAEGETLIRDLNDELCGNQYFELF